jgi:hypothetical protein
VSVDFDPVRLGPRRRRVDPVMVGVIGVVVALAIAVIKPWDRAAAPVKPGQSVAVGLPTSAATRAPAAAPSTGRASPEPAIPLSWADVASAITTRDGWGVRVITVDQRGDKQAIGPSSYHELWSAAITSAGVETATVGRYGDPLSILGFTSPATERPRDVRIWRVHRGDRLEWIDAVQIAAQPTEASLLFVRPGPNRGTLTPWDPGRYRVDFLVAGGIHRLSVTVPDPRGVVPPLDTWLPDRPAVVEAGASDPSGVRIGLFATVGGVGVSLPARETRPLDDDAAWLDLSDGANDVVATAYLPNASGLGVMLTEHAAISDALIRRLAPEDGFIAPDPTGGISESHGRTPYVLFAPPDDAAVWAPGVYAISVSWSDGAGVHAGTWHVELRPGVG